jgi:regulator of protease activity HflC (stomatin/prohibitin superfamily)
MSCARVDPGYIGVKVKTLGQNKGVEPEVLPVGRFWLGVQYDLYTYPTFVTIFPFTASSDEGSEIDEAMRFQSKEGISCNVDVALSARVDAPLAAIAFQFYRKEMLDIIKMYGKQDMNNYFVEFASRLNVEEIYSTQKMAMLSFVKDKMREKFAPSGIIIEDIAYKSDIRFPQNVIDAINEKIAATQIALQKEQEIFQSRADAQKKIATAEGEAISILKVAEAQAKANTLLSNSITPTLVNYELAKKWNGTSPTYMGNGSVLPPLFK